MRLFGIENFRKTRRNRIIISGRGARIIDSDEYFGTISIISNTCSVIENHRNSTMVASN